MSSAPLSAKYSVISHQLIDISKRNLFFLICICDILHLWQGYFHIFHNRWLLLIFWLDLWAVFLSFSVSYCIKVLWLALIQVATKYWLLSLISSLWWTLAIVLTNASSGSALTLTVLHLLSQQKFCPWSVLLQMFLSLWTVINAAGLSIGSCLHLLNHACSRGSHMLLQCVFQYVEVVWMNK